LDHVGWDKCIVIGISFGGMVAQEFAVTFPERVEKLVLLCTSAGGDAGASYPLHENVGLDPATRGAKMRTIFDTRFTDDFLANDKFAAAMAKMLADRELVAKSDDVLRGEAMQLEARRHHDVASRLGNITCPTLVTAGRYDGIAPVANSEAIAAQIPGAELRTYEGGHLFIRMYADGMNAAAIITSARTRARLSKRELARRVGTSPAAIVEYESGRRSPTIDSLDMILRVCGVDIALSFVDRSETERLEKCGRDLAAVLELADSLPKRVPNADVQWPLLPGSRAVRL
ncbi:MAG: alpha/beta fold hydrolase, partial [Actinobacteria bacterium]|nr:alpha/beta fold hydrolase [Actinomycetota bacterium]